MTPAGLALSTLRTLQGLGLVKTLIFDWSTRTYEPSGDWSEAELQHVRDNASLYGLRLTQSQPWQPARLVSTENTWDESFAAAPIQVVFPDPAPAQPTYTPPPQPTYSAPSYVVYTYPTTPATVTPTATPVVSTPPPSTTTTPTTPTTPAVTTPAPTTPAPTTPAATTPAPSGQLPFTPLSEAEINALYAQDLVRLRNGAWEYQWADGVWRNVPDPQQLAKWTQAGRVATGQGTPFVYAGGVTPSGGASGRFEPTNAAPTDQLTAALDAAKQWMQEQPLLTAAAAATAYYVFFRKGRR
ncbi:MAG TPA: hypothetical protein VER03_01835 [Bryobacteraceae bacterium]|nr:hypothetical protein [Bryobacteraceae bacterium]